MERLRVNDVELEYEVRGAGEPVLLVHGGLLADENAPLARESALTDRYRVIHYHRRGFAGSSKGRKKATIETHAADAKALLDELGVERAHVVGHSLGGTISIQLALDHPESVHTLALMEPALMAAIAKSQASPEEAVKSQKEFRTGMEKVSEIYETGDARGALTAFLETRAGGSFREVLDWLTTTGEFDQAAKDADTFLNVEVPAAFGWDFTPEAAGRITQPVVSILGSHSPERARKVHEVLRQWVPHTDELTLPNADHALPLMDPPGIAAAIARWLERYPIGGLAEPTLPNGADDERWARIASASGIAWVTLVAASFAIAGLGPPPGSKMAAFPVYFRKSRGRVLASVYLRSLGALASFPFIVYLWDTLRRAEGDPPLLAMLSLSSATVGHGMAMAGNAYHGVAAFHPDEVNPELSQTLYYLGTVFYSAGLALAPFMAATGAAILKTNAFPRWLGWWAIIDAPVILLGRLPVESKVKEGIDVLGIIAFFAFIVTLSRKMNARAAEIRGEQPKPRKKLLGKRALVIGAVAVAAVGAAAILRK